MYREHLNLSLVCAGVLIGLLMSLAGCTAAPTEPPVAADTEGAPPPVIPAETAITIVIPEDPPSFNAIVGDTGYDSLVMHMALLGLTGIDPEGVVYPILAADLPTVENGGVVQDEENYTMDVTWQMRDDVKWSDGTLLTAEDVLFTYEAIINPETGIWIPGIDYVDSLEKIDEHSFVVHFNAIYPGYLTMFGGEQIVIWPKHACDAEQGFIAWDCARKPVSSGPYILEEWAVGDHMTFVKNPNYFEPGKPEIDTIYVRVVPDTAVRETMLTTGEADVLMWATEQNADNLKDKPGVKLSISPTSRWVMRLFFNLAAKGSTDPVSEPNPFLSDVRVRQAIRMAIDVDTISKNVFRGYSTPVWTEFFREPYTCEIPRPKYDPEGARALLEQAGWLDQDGNGVVECRGCGTAEEGQEMAMELLTYAEFGEPLELSQQLIGEMLAAVGIKTELSIMQGSVMWADYASNGIEQTGNFEIDFYDDGYSGNDPTDFIYQYYYSASAEPDYGWNVGRWMNEDFDALLDEAYSLDEAQRKDLFCQMAQILDQELPQILLFSVINADAYSDRLSGVQANNNDVVTWNVADWKITK